MHYTYQDQKDTKDPEVYFPLNPNFPLIVQVGAVGVVLPWWVLPC